MADKTLHPVQATPSHRLTADEFEALYIDQAYELIDGIVTEIMPTGITHGGIVRRTAALLGAFVDKNGLGEVVTGEVGFKLDVYTMRAPDVAFIPSAAMNALANPEKFGAAAPALAVEIVAPHDRATGIKAKIDKFLSTGTQIVWVIDPDQPHITVYQQDQPPRYIPLTGTLDGGDVLPGLQIAVADLFPPQPV